MEKIHYIGYGIVIVGIMMVFGWLAQTAFNTNEINECMKWQQQARAYEGFFLTQWQADQCHAHGITISAPIK